MSGLAGLFLGETKGQAPQPEATPTVLLVDDEKMVRSALRRLFQSTDYRVLIAESAEEALTILSRDEVDLIISDHRMPRMTGAELLSTVRDRYPETLRIMLTGCSDVEAIMGAVSDGAVYKFITKPWNDEDLLVTAARALEAGELARENRQLRQAHSRAKAELNKIRAENLKGGASQLGMLLVRRGVISQEDADRAAELQKESGAPLSVVFVAEKIVRAEQISKALHQELSIDVVDLAEYPAQPAAISLIPESVCTRHSLMPVSLQGNKLTVAMSDPTDFAKIDELSFMTGFSIRPLIATTSAIDAAVQRYYGTDADDPFALPEEADPGESLEIVLDDLEEDVDELLSADMPPAIRLVNAILAEAIRLGASDVHMEPRVKYLSIRYRIDGLLSEKFRIPKDMQAPVLSRLKITAGLDIADRRRPQDGRVSVRYGTRMVDMRVATLPTVHGEKIVIRLLDRNGKILSLEELGLAERQRDRISTFIHKPQGMIIATGPTSSGKTTTLYSLLGASSTPDKSIITIEDPVEYHLENAGQVFVREKAGLTFAKTLRSVLRQDPNVIMLGEVRDKETAEVAFQAAMTGHTVLSTLHTNSSVASISRLLDLGIPRYVLASAVEGIIAQRLVRRICPDCRTEKKPATAMLNALRVRAEDVEPVYYGAGCERCNDQGYAGQVGVYEILLMTEDLRQLILAGAPESEIVRAARSGGMVTLLEDALAHARAGVTTLDEILRVLGPTPPGRSCGACGGTVSVDFRVCPHCCDTLKHTCGGCQTLLEPSWRACPYCGERSENPHPTRVGGSHVEEAASSDR